MRREEEPGNIAGRVQIGELVAAVVGDFDWSIVRVYAKQGGSEYTLYTPSGGKQSVQLTPGSNWELHVQWQCTNNNKGIIPWTACVTMLASGVPSGYEQQWKPMSMEIATNFNSDFGLNMGAMPSANVTITRLKFWATQSLSSTAPPIASW